MTTKNGKIITKWNPRKVKGKTGFLEALCESPREEKRTNKKVKCDYCGKYCKRTDRQGILIRYSCVCGFWVEWENEENKNKRGGLECWRCGNIMKPEKDKDYFNGIVLVCECGAKVGMERDDV